MTGRIVLFAISILLVLVSLPTRVYSQSFSPGQSTRCLALPADVSADISPTREQLAHAWGKDSIEFAEDLQYLSIDASELPMLGFKQQLIPNEKGSTRSQVKWSLAPTKIYQLTQKVFFSPNFDWGGRYEGGKIGFGLAGGSAPTGGQIADDGFTARFKWRGNHDGTARLVVYSYASDRTQNLPYGDDYRLTDVIIPTGEWFEITLQVEMNSSPSQSDGAVRAWFNGIPALSLNGIRWQSEGADAVIDSIIYASFYGGGNSLWSPENETYIRFADVCLTTPAPKQRI